MNATLKKVLVRSAKNAVNAALITIAPLIHDSLDYNFHDWHGLSHVLSLVGGAIVTREVLVWLPVLLKWSQDNNSSLSLSGGTSAPKS